MLTCKKCNAEKPEDQMKVRGGKPSKVCIECDDAAKAERERLKKILRDAREESIRTRKKRKKSASVATTKAKAKRVVAVEPNEVRIMPGLGVHAFITEDERLQISQKNDNAPNDNIVLSRTEAKVIFAQFHDWVETIDPS